jgi:hypothetical protein
MKFLVCVVEGLVEFLVLCSFALKGAMTGLYYGVFMILFTALSMSTTMVMFCYIVFLHSKL